MKTSILSNTLCFNVIFFQIWNGKPLAFKPIFGQKTSILTKLLYFGSIKSIGCHYFQMFFEKIKGFMPIFCQKIIYFLKTHFSYVHILSKKRPFSQKTLFSHYFFKFLHEKPPALIRTLNLWAQNGY